MALIKCIDCGKEISDKAVACPNCGCPVCETIKHNEDPEVKKYEFIKNKLKENNYFKSKTILDCQKELQIPQEELKSIIEKMLEEREKEQQERNVQIKRQEAFVACEEYKNERTNNIKCPTCGSTNVEKMGMIGKMASVGFFGLASDSVGKTFKCNACGYKW